MMVDSLAFRLLDAHVVAGRADEPAWLGDGGSLTYAQLLHESAAIAGGLKHLGVRTGDVVALELEGRDRVVALLALVRLAAVPGPDGSVGIVGSSGAPVVVRLPDDEVAWNVVRDLGRGDPAAALRTDPDGYEVRVAPEHADVIEPLLRGEPLR